MPSNKGRVVLKMKEKVNIIERFKKDETGKILEIFQLSGQTLIHTTFDIY